MKNFLRGLAILIWFAATLVVVRGIAPTMISSRDDLSVVLGFALAAVWLLGSGCYGYYLLNRGKGK